MSGHTAYDNVTHEMLVESAADWVCRSRAQVERSELSLARTMAEARAAGVSDVWLAQAER